MTRLPLALALFAILVLAGCSSSPSEPGPGKAANSGGGGSEVHGTLSAVGDAPATNSTQETDPSRAASGSD